MRLLLAICFLSIHSAAPSAWHRALQQNPARIPVNPPTNPEYVDLTNDGRAYVVPPGKIAEFFAVSAHGTMLPNPIEDRFQAWQIEISISGINFFQNRPLQWFFDDYKLFVPGLILGAGNSIEVTAAGSTWLGINQYPSDTIILTLRVRDRLPSDDDVWVWSFNLLGTFRVPPGRTLFVHGAIRPPLLVATGQIVCGDSDFATPCFGLADCDPSGTYLVPFKISPPDFDAAPGQPLSVGSYPKRAVAGKYLCGFSAIAWGRFERP